MIFNLDDSRNSNHRISKRKRFNEIFSMKEIKDYPFELFKAELPLNSLFDNKNHDSRIDWAMEYELIYNSHLTEF